jgi:hypothetical protein
MSKTRWAVDGPDGTFLELNGRKFSADDDGAPMMCNLVCQDMGRHVHLDYCRTNTGDRCGGAEMQHIATRLTPHADRPKDWISHGLYWRRSGTSFTFHSTLCLLSDYPGFKGNSLTHSELTSWSVPNRLSQTHTPGMTRLIFRSGESPLHYW